MYLKENLKLLRKRLKRSQEEVAKSLNITRSAYNSYENGVAEPGIGSLLRIADFFHINLDKLVKINLADVPENQLTQLEKGYDMDISGTRLRVLSTTVDLKNNENVELVPLKAKAGYTAGYADPDYISVLPAFNLPFLSPNKKYRTFPISGDSMPPVSNGSFVTGEYLQNWNMIRNGVPYIIVTKDEGIVFKVIYNRIEDDGTILLCSTNPQYEPYTVKIDDVLEIWKFVNYINPAFEEPRESSDGDIAPALRNIQKEIGIIKEKMGSIESRMS